MFVIWFVHFSDIIKIDLKIGGGFASSCGGSKIKIKLVDSDRECSTVESAGFSYGSTLNWENRRLKTCQHYRLTSQTKVYILENSGDDFCPQIITFFLRNGFPVKTEEFDDWFLEDGRKGEAWKLQDVPSPLPSLDQSDFSVTEVGNQTNKQLNVQWSSPVGYMDDFDNYLVT